MGAGGAIVAPTRIRLDRGNPEINSQVYSISAGGTVLQCIHGTTHTHTGNTLYILAGQLADGNRAAVTLESVAREGIQRDRGIRGKVSVRVKWKSIRARLCLKG